ncbi:MAG: cytochrome c-type biogenesis protein [Pseudomonadota bacterium]
MRGRPFAIVFLVLVASVAAAQVANPDEALDDPALEARARALDAAFRCVVCQSQSIADSDAPLAKDMRVLIREQIAGGASDAEVRAFLLTRYGDYVLLKPRLTGGTAALWLGPALFGALGIAGAVVFLRRAGRNFAEASAGGAGPDSDDPDDGPPDGRDP